MVLAAVAAIEFDWPGVASLGVILSVFMVFEYDRMWSQEQKLGLLGFWRVLAVPSVLTAFCYYKQFPAYYFAALLLIIFGISLGIDILRERQRPILRNLSPIYIGLGVMSILWIYRDFGGFALAFIFLITISNDVGAYLTGRSLKGAGPKLAPDISPNKTLFGAIGGVIVAFAIVTSYVIMALWNRGVDSVQVVSIIGAVTILLSILSICGDLFESKMKRLCGVKDSSSIIPGHGGFLDRFDSILFVAPAFAALISARILMPI